jgi:transposase-like protein
MVEISYRRHGFPPVVVQHAVWLYLRFALSYRDVEDLLAEGGPDISHETIRSWVLKFEPTIAGGYDRFVRGRATVGIWMRWWSGLSANGRTLGVPSTMKVRSSTCWFSAGATAELR